MEHRSISDFRRLEKTSVGLTIVSPNGKGLGYMPAGPPIWAYYSRSKLSFPETTKNHKWPYVMEMTHVG